jgi:hypothetical protein
MNYTLILLGIYRTHRCIVCQAKNFRIHDFFLLTADLPREMAAAPISWGKHREMQVSPISWGEHGFVGGRRAPPKDVARVEMAS